MKSEQIQYIIVFIILGVIVVWAVYTLVKKRPTHIGTCAGCSLAENCKKKNLYENRKIKPASCNDCPETTDCEKKDLSVGCGGNTDKHREE